MNDTPSLSELKEALIAADKKIMWLIDNMGSSRPERFYQRTRWEESKAREILLRLRDNRPGS